MGERGELRAAGCVSGTARSRAGRPAATRDRDGRAGSGRSARRASPCRSPPARRSARHGRAGRRDRRRSISACACAWPTSAGGEARRARAGIDVALRRALLRRRPLHAASGEMNGPSRSRTAAQMASATASSVGARVDDDAALRRRLGDGEKGARARRAMELQALASKRSAPLPRRAAPRRARAPAPAAMSSISVRSGPSSPTATCSSRSMKAAFEPAGGALIGARRIRRSGRTPPRRRARAPGGSARRDGRCARR